MGSIASAIANAFSRPEAEMSLRVYRAETGQWEDGPKVHSAATNLPAQLLMRLKILTKLLAVFDRWLKKLEAMR